MNYILTPPLVDKLRKMGCAQGRNAPQRAVLIMPGKNGGTSSVVIDEYGYRSQITLEEALELLGEKGGIYMRRRFMVPRVAHCGEGHSRWSRA